jgi:hypothetical protein
MNLLDQQCAARYWAGKLDGAAESLRTGVDGTSWFLFARQHLSLVCTVLGRYRQAGDVFVARCFQFRRSIQD